jgi:hypothetical protein
MSVNFILQAIRVLHLGTYTDSEIQMIYDFLKSLDNETLNLYHITNTVVSYDNDLELYIEIIDTLIKIFENQEAYEKCAVLLDKKNEALSITELKTEKV